MRVTQDVIDTARRERANHTGSSNCWAFGQFQLPDGACTSVDPSIWEWQCSPGVGSVPTCVGVPQAAYVAAAVTQGLLPTVPAVPPSVVRLVPVEETAPYQAWDSCISGGGPLYAEQYGCAADAVVAGTAAAAGVPEWYTKGPSLQCLLMAGAAAFLGSMLLGKRGGRG